MSVQVIGCLSATVLYLFFFLRLRSCSFGTVWKGCERIVFGLPELGLWRRVAFSDPLPAFSAPCGRVANAPFLACLFSGLCFACLGHEACCRSRLSEASHRGILLGVGSNFAWAPSRHHGTSADGLAWALLSAPPRHLALRYTGFGPSLAARVLATRKNVLWIPKVTGSIFSGLCFWLA